MLVNQVLAINLKDVYKPGEALGGTNATLSNLINPIIANVLTISGIIAFGVILVAGFSYISAGGDKAKTAQAGQMLTNGIIGIVVVSAAFLITKLIGAILGFKFL